MVSVGSGPATRRASAFPASRPMLLTGEIGQGRRSHHPYWSIRAPYRVNIYGKPTGTNISAFSCVSYFALRRRADYHVPGTYLGDKIPGTWYEITQQALRKLRGALHVCRWLRALYIPWDVIRTSTRYTRCVSCRHHQQVKRQ